LNLRDIETALAWPTVITHVVDGPRITRVPCFDVPPDPDAESDSLAVSPIRPLSSE